MNEVLEKIGMLGIVPVVRIEHAKDALPLGKALLEGDLPIVEITFRTDAAKEAIRLLTQNYPELLVGAGTVLTIEQAKKAVEAGAKFIVSPGFNPNVVDYCLQNNMPVTPGVNSPSQIEMALEHGLQVLKFFPAESSGGVKFIKDMSGPYGSVNFIPTGGINITNLNTYLAEPNVYACAGSWMVSANLISEGKFTEITRLVREAIYTMLGFEFGHLGINEEGDIQARESANIFSNLFAFPITEKSNSYFAGKGLELLKTPRFGKQGHIAIATNNIQRAIAFFNRKGVPILSESKAEEGGKLRSVFLKQEISGFAIHLLQK